MPRKPLYYDSENGKKEVLGTNGSFQEVPDAPTSALPTEYPATYAAMQASITSDPTTKRDFFVSADETNGGGKTHYYYNASSPIRQVDDLYMSEYTRDVQGFPITLVPCTSRLIMPNQNYYSAVTPTITYRSNHKVLRPTSFVRFMFVNQSQTGNASNSFTLTATVQAVPTSGTNIGSVGYKIIKFNGSASVTIAAGDYVISDPIWLPLNPENGAFYLVKSCCTSAASTNNWPVGLTLNGTYEGTSTGDQTQNSAATFTSAGLGFAPAMILTPQRGIRRSFHGVGDSIMDGSNDVVNNRGFFERFIGDNNLSGNRAAVAGERLDTVTSNIRFNFRWIHALSASHVFCEYGTNDIGNSVALATVQQNLINYWYGFYSFGQRVYQFTILPRSASTDNFVTTTNQSTNSYESVRTGLNDWLKAGAPCTVSGYTVTPVAIGTVGAVRCPYLYGYIDVCSVVEVDSSNVLTANGGRWKVGNTIKTGTATSATGTTLVDTSANFSSLSVAGAFIRITGGTGNGQVNWIVGAQSASQVNLLNTWGVTPAAGSTYEIIDTYTRDGTHPSANAHQYLANYLSSIYTAL
jgi:lysophospholipase L1-like esterase